MHPDLYGTDPFYHPYLNMDILDTNYSFAYEYPACEEIDVCSPKLLKGGLKQEWYNDCLLISLEYADDFLAWMEHPDKSGKELYFQGYQFVIGSDNAGFSRFILLQNEKTKEVWHDGLYHTGDTAWKDEDGYFWYVGRVDDVIKSSGYRIGPFEIESVIMELPYVLECGVSAAPDPVRGQVVKASIVLTKGTVGTDELKKEIQTYVKEHTAPYKYPRIVEFMDELPKTISG